MLILFTRCREGFAASQRHREFFLRGKIILAIPSQAVLFYKSDFGK